QPPRRVPGTGERTVRSPGHGPHARAREWSDLLHGAVGQTRDHDLGKLGHPFTLSTARAGENERMRIVVLTGAGISAESGVPTFRGGDGLWEGHRVEDVATPEAFERDPETVHAFYDRRRGSLAHVQPNAAHEALARLESVVGEDLLVVTQNV